MDDALKIWDEALKTVQVLTTWPLVALYLVLLFRKALAEEIHPLFRMLQALLGRLTTLKIGELQAGFQAFAAKASPQLAQEVAGKLNGAQDEVVHSQPVDEQKRTLVATAPITNQSFGSSKSFGILSTATEQEGADQKKIVDALASGEFYWRTHERLLALTSLPPEKLDPALTSLLQQDVVRTAFSSNHNVIFGLRERVQGR